jgi:hypothetical protein
MMQARRASIENPDTASQSVVCCSQCGWPGIGKMPAGVQVLRQNGKDSLIGRLCYYQVRSELCAVCQAMESAVASRPWFVAAHAEYLQQVKIKKQMLNEG